MPYATESGGTSFGLYLVRIGFIGIRGRENTAPRVLSRGATTRNPGSEPDNFAKHTEGASNGDDSWGH
jgi:hypothetical protein